MIIQGLLDLGCNSYYYEASPWCDRYTEDALKAQLDLDEINNLCKGAKYVCSIISSKKDYINIQDELLKEDNEESLYALVRKITKDDSYTKDNVVNRGRTR